MWTQETIICPRSFVSFCFPSFFFISSHEDVSFTGAAEPSEFCPAKRAIVTGSCRNTGRNLNSFLPDSHRSLLLEFIETLLELVYIFSWYGLSVPVSSTLGVKWQRPAQRVSSADLQTARGPPHSCLSSTERTG